MLLFVVQDTLMGAEDVSEEEEKEEEEEEEAEEKREVVTRRKRPRIEIEYETEQLPPAKLTLT